MRQINDLRGKQFGYLTPLKISGKNSRGYLWYCKCKCGNYKTVPRDSLVSGNTRSCGCLVKEMNETKIKKIHESYSFEPNKYIQLDDNTIIGYTNTSNFIFDREFYPIIKQYRWHTNGNGYIETGFKKDMVNDLKQQSICLHQLLLNTRFNGMIADHINGDRSDCRMENLRLSNYKLNTQNRRTINRSGFKGVYKVGNKFSAYANDVINNKRQYLGVYNTAKEAAIKYDEFVFSLYGWYAKLNFPQDYNNQIQIQKRNYFIWMFNNINTIIKEKYLKECLINYIENRGLNK